MDAMELFGLSAAKIILILIIAIILFGPTQVSEMTQKAGRTIRDVRRYINGMTREFNEATGGLREEFTAITQDLKGELAATQADLRNQLDLTSLFHEARTGGAEGFTDSASAATAVAVASVSAATMIGTEADAAPAALLPTDSASDMMMIAANGHGRGAVPWATRADPLADLVVLSRGGVQTPTISSINGHRNITVQTVRATAVTERASARCPHRLVIGRSVAGSAYLRRKGATSGTCQRRWRGDRNQE